MTTRTYDPQKVQVILGAAPVSGFADGTFITIEQDDASWMKKAGADGEVVRTRKASRMATMTLTLLATSTFNAILTALHASDAIFPVLVKDGATIIPAGEAWVEKPPAFERGAEAADAEWVIALAKWTPVFGGNP